MDYRIINSETVHQGRAFNVERVQTRLPDGRLTFYDLVKHEDSVSIVPVDKEGNIWFVNQFRIGTGKTLLELPAGVFEPGETPLKCARREIREEIGMAAGQLKLLGEMYLAPGYSSENMYIFLATNLRPDPLKADVDEFIQTQTIPVSQVFQMVKNKDIHDSKTLASLLLAKSYLDSFL